MEAKIGMNSNSYKRIASLFMPAECIYSLAVHGDILYCGSDRGKVRILFDLQNLSHQHCSSLTTSGSGFPVKSLLITVDRIYMGDQCGKIQIWRRPNTNTKTRSHKLAATLPSLRDCLQNSMDSSKYVQVRRHHKRLWIKHNDAISCLALDEGPGLLYSASWDKTVKVWRLSDLKCIESIDAHDDAVNAMALGRHGLLFTGSADGTLKLWRRTGGPNPRNRGIKICWGRGHQQHHRHYHPRWKHQVMDTLAVGASAVVNSIAVSEDGSWVYYGCSDGVLRYCMMERKKKNNKTDNENNNNTDDENNNVEEWRSEMKQRGSLVGHRLAVLCVSIGNCGRIICSGSGDRTIRVWRREGVQHCCAAVLEGHGAPVKCLALSPATNYAEENGWVVYSAGLDGSLKAWLVSGH